MAGFSIPADLVERLRRGEEPAWGEFHLRACGVMERIARRILGSRTEAEDAQQEALMSLHRSIAAYDPARPFEPWFYAIVNRACLKRLRDRAPEARALPDLPAPAIEEGRGSEVSRAIDRLPARDRFLVVARFLEGRSNREIAEDLDMTPIAVGVAVHRAVKHLRSIVGAP